MPRKTKVVPINSEGRDKGKHYLITEMPAAQAEMWAVRAFLALGRSNADIPELETYAGLGMAGIAYLGLRAILKIEMAEAGPLLEEMMGCVQFLADPKKLDTARALHYEDDIEEVPTRYYLRSEVFELHVGFSVAGALSKSVSAIRDAVISGNTSTSPAPSDQ